MGSLWLSGQGIRLGIGGLTLFSNLLSITVPRTYQGWPCSPKMGLIIGRQSWLEKHIPSKDAAPLMLLSRNLLFSTLGFQITNDFVWKSQTGKAAHSSKFVKLLYLIIWDARTNLIRFYWNLHYLFPQHELSSNFLPITIPRPQGGPCCPIVGEQGTLKKIPRVLGYSVPDVPKQKYAFHGSQRKMYKNALGEMSLTTITLCTLSSYISAPKQKLKKCPGCYDTVSLMFLSKNLLFRTLGSQRNMYKKCWTKCWHEFGETYTKLFALKLNNLSQLPDKNSKT